MRYMHLPALSIAGAYIQVCWQCEPYISDDDDDADDDDDDDHHNNTSVVAVVDIIIYTVIISAPKRLNFSSAS